MAGPGPAIPGRRKGQGSMRHKMQLKLSNSLSLFRLGRTEFFLACLSAVDDLDCEDFGSSNFAYSNTLGALCCRRCSKELGGGCSIHRFNLCIEWIAQDKLNLLVACQTQDLRILWRDQQIHHLNLLWLSLCVLRDIGTGR